MSEKWLDTLLFSKRSGKTIMQQEKWAFKKCLDCGGKLELINCNEYEEVKQCQNCGRKTLLLKIISNDKRREKIIEDKNNCVLNKDAKYPCKAYNECLKIQDTNKPLPCMVNWMMGRPFENMIKKEGDDERETI